MRAALREAEKGAAAGEIPVGAVVISAEGKILARAHNRSVTATPTATPRSSPCAERRALPATPADRLPPRRDARAVPMCAGAAVIARVAEIIYGTPDPKGGAVSTLYRIASDPRLNHRAAVTSGVLAEECAALLMSFFRSRRPAPPGKQ